MSISKLGLPAIVSLALFSFGCSSSSNNIITKALIATPTEGDISSTAQFMMISAQTGFVAEALDELGVSAKKEKRSRSGYQYYDHDGGVLPSARGCAGSEGPYLVGSYIYWRASFDDFSDVGLEIPVIDSETKVKLKTPHYPYDSGVKIGLGYNLPGDAWDLFFNWTYLRTRPHLSLKNGNGVIIPTLGLPRDNQTPFVALGSESHGHIQINVGDFEMGRNFYVGSFLALRPYVGAKSIWFKNLYKTSFSGTSVTGTPSSIISEALDTLKANAWGIGPRLGINSRWSLGTPYVAALVTASGSLLWENTGLTQSSSYIENGLHQGRTSQVRVKSLHPFLEIFAGLDFGGCLSESDVALYFSAGWEVQWWFHQLSNVPGLPSQSLNLQGLTTSLRLDF